MAQKGRGIFMVYVDIDAQHVQEFNKWYNEEHLPELLSVPGILSAARYEAVKGGPQYLACYELESVAVMQTPAFTNRPRTPRGQKVSPSVIGKNLTRIVGEQIHAPQRRDVGGEEISCLYASICVPMQHRDRSHLRSYRFKGRSNRHRICCVCWKRVGSDPAGTQR